MINKIFVVKQNLILLIGAILGILTIFLPGTLFMFFCSSLICLCIRYFAKEEDKSFLIKLFISGMLLRAVLAIIIYWVSNFLSLGYHVASELHPLLHGGYNPCIIGDSAVISQKALWLSQILHHKLQLQYFSSPDTLFTPTDNHFRIFALFYYFFGFDQIGGRLLNSLFSVGTALIIYYITKDIFNRQTARYAALITAFFPSALIWSTTYLKEPANGFFFCLFIFSIQRLINYKKIIYICLLIVSLFFSLVVRYEFGIFLLATLFLIISIIFLKNLVKISPLLFFILAVIAIPLIIHYAKPSLQIIETKFLFHVNHFISRQRGILTGGGSTYKIYHDDLKYFTTIKEMLSIAFIMSIVKGVVFFLFTPFPWGVSSKIQLIFSPQIIFWYFLFLFALFGMLFSMRHYFKKSFFIIIILLLFSIFSGMNSGNIGSVFRHRDVILPVFFIFSAAGIVFKLGIKSKS